MNESYFKFAERVYLLGNANSENSSLYTIMCTKFVSLPGGESGYFYQAQNEDGVLYKDVNGNTWIAQTSMKKQHQPSRLSFKELMVNLGGIVEEGDFQ